MGSYPRLLGCLSLAGLTAIAHISTLDMILIDVCHTKLFLDIKFYIFESDLKYSILL